MQIIGVILVLISVGTIVGPIGAVAFTYRDNLVQLVVPPQINDLMNGNSSIFYANTTNPDGEGEGIGTGDSDFGGILAPVIVDTQIDNVSRTFSLTVNFTNTFNIDLTLNQFSADAISSQDNYPLGSVQLSQPVQINAGQTAQLFITGLWTQNAENYFTTQHAGSTSIDVSLVNVLIDVNGITIQQTEPVSIGSVPIV
jgi:hypothetical protein